MNPLPSQERLRLLFFYENGSLIWRPRQDRDASWNTKYAGRSAGLIRGDGRYIVRVDGVSYLGYRLIWALLRGAIPDGMEIDHIDGQPANNAIENLRLATSSQNKMNRISPDRRLPRGVRRSLRKYEAYVKKEGVMHYLGVYDTEGEASAAYLASAKVMFGEFYDGGDDPG